MPDKQFNPNSIALKWKYDRQVRYEAKALKIMKSLKHQLFNLENEFEFIFESMEGVGIDEEDGSLFRLTIKKEEITNQF